MCCFVPGRIILDRFVVDVSAAQADGGHPVPLDCEVPGTCLEDDPDALNIDGQAGDRPCLSACASGVIMRVIVKASREAKLIDEDEEAGHG